MLARTVTTTAPAGRESLTRDVRDLARAIEGMSIDPGSRRARQEAAEQALSVTQRVARQDSGAASVAEHRFALRMVAADVIAFAGANPDTLDEHSGTELRVAPPPPSVSPRCPCAGVDHDRASSPSSAAPRCAGPAAPARQGAPGGRGAAHPSRPPGTRGAGSPSPHPGPSRGPGEGTRRRQRPWARGPGGRGCSRCPPPRPSSWRQPWRLVPHHRLHRGERPGGPRVRGCVHGDPDRRGDRLDGADEERPQVARDGGPDSRDHGCQVPKGLRERG